MPILTGRLRVYTSFPEINRGNLLQALSETNAIHFKNRRDIRFLFRYYRGNQPVYQRRKAVRPDITHNTVVNHASEIVSFKVSYLLGDPAVYVLRKADETLSEDVRRLNDFMELADKDSCDKEIADDFTICGVAYRFVYPNQDYEEGEAPFTIDTYDPQYTYLAYEMSPSRDPKPVFGCVCSRDKRNERDVYDVYTADTHYTVTGDLGGQAVIEEEVNQLGEIPLVEYCNNQFRIGGFEPVIDLLDATNILESNRVEATEQLVQALTWFNDVELEKEDIDALRASPNAFVFTRTVKGATTPSIKTITVDLQQQDQQVLQNDLYKKILTIVGMPSTSDGNSNDSSNNGSTLVRNGWYQAESRAKDTAKLWERSDKKFLRLVLKCANELCSEPLKLTEKDVTGKFTRRNYEDILTKANVLTMLLGSTKVAPQFAYAVSGLAPDPEEACRMGLDWMEKENERNRLAEASLADRGNEQGTGSGERRGAAPGEGPAGARPAGPNGENESGNRQRSR